MENRDDIKRAVDGLSIFRHSWCMNLLETSKANDLVFRCKECPFVNSDNQCSIKIFIRDYGTEKQVEESKVIV